MDRIILVSADAEKDEDAIFTWIYERSPDGAIAWLSAFGVPLND